MREGVRQQKTPSGWEGAKKRVKGVESDSNPVVSTENEHTPDTGAAKASVAVSPPVSADEDLRLILASWDRLPADVRKMIAGVVRLMTKAAPDGA
jgi:hypothetical protein